MLNVAEPQRVAFRQRERARFSTYTCVVSALPTSGPTMLAFFTGNRPHSSRLSLAACLGSMLLGTVLVGKVLSVPAQDSQPPRDESLAANQADASKAKRHREGMLLQKLEGVIQSAADSYVLLITGADGKPTGEQFRLLENLALERAATLLQQSESPEEKLWVVSGIVTEFKQTNYLLMTRVVAKEQVP